VDSLNLTPDEAVFEIGAGQGVLTQFLIQKVNKVYAVELDRSLVEVLEQKFSDTTKLEIISGDVLKVRLSDYFQSGEKIKIVGSLPYQITSPILEWLVNQRELIKLAVVTVQKEVAKRFCARPGTREWSSVSISCQVYFQPRLLFTLSAGSFFPAPKVQSAVLSLTTLSNPLVSSDNEINFFKLVRKIFTARRKTLLRVLIDRTDLPKPKLEQLLLDLEFSPQIRGESLTIPQLIRLSQALTESAHL
jgi:16S rRNA (adenine1518-N6/adenine1519-N6)-dimethyltransferase